jgi:hypothetical protein
MSDRLTAASAHARIDTHEAECTLRYEVLHGSISELKDGMKWVIRLGLGILLSVTGWLAVQLYNQTAHVPVQVEQVK